MSEGNNSAFKKRKEFFLAGHPMTVGFIQANMPGAAGIYDFDIQDLAMAGGHVLEVTGFANRAKQAIGCFTHRISAYWLPWASRATVHLDIGNGADYFFTSELNGCQFRVARTGPATVRTIHVAGDSPNSALLAGSTWRNNQAQALLTPAQQVLSRRFTSSALLGAVVPGAAGAAGIGGMIGYDGAHSWQNIFGFRHWHVFGPTTWDFWYQTVALAPGGAGYIAQVARLALL